jgi:carbon storage regulator
MTHQQPRLASFRPGRSADSKEDFSMLVLTRKLGEKILIGGDIAITVVDIGSSRVKLGIEAPAGHRILRSELIVELEQPSTVGDDDAAFMRTESVSRRSSSRRVAGATEPVGV